MRQQQLYRDSAFSTSLFAFLAIVFWFLVVGSIVGGVILFAPYARGAEPSQYQNKPPAVREWFQKLMQPDNPSQSCCGEADAFEADTFEVADDHYVAIITDGKGILPSGTRIAVPNSKMKWDQGNPTGHGIIFLSGEIDRPGEGNMYVNVNGKIRILYCYVAPTGA